MVFGEWWRTALHRCWCNTGAASACAVTVVTATWRKAERVVVVE